MPGSPKKRRRRKRLERLAALQASGITPGAPLRLTCAFCGQARPPKARSCGKPECLQARREREADRKRALIAKRMAAGTCIACGRTRDPRPATKTGRPILRCKRCRVRDRSWHRRDRNRKMAAKTKAAAIVRLAEVAIERKRAQQARLDAGLGLSFSAVPVVPKDTPRPQQEL